VEFQGTSRVNLGGPGSVDQVSASVDPNTGFGEVFALSSSGSHSLIPVGPLWLCDSHGTWHDFGGQYEQISATQDGHVYAITSGGTVRYLDSNGNGPDLGSPQTNGGSGVTDLAAGLHHALIGGSTNNVVYVIGADGAIYVNYANASGKWQVVDHSKVFDSLSASGTDTIFATTSYTNDGPTFVRIYELNGSYHFNGSFFSFSWMEADISGGRTNWWAHLSADTDAAGNAEVYDIDQQGNAYLYDQGKWTQKASHVYDIAAAGSGYFYDVNYPPYGYYAAWLYSPTGVPWTGLGTNLS
jgi:hypothetical protein